MYSYGLFAACFVVVLLISIGCNICISNYRLKAILQQVGERKHETENANSGDENIPESVSIGELSNISPKYETINENEIAMFNSTNDKHLEHVRTQNRKSAPLSDQSYLDVIDGDDDSATDEDMIELGLLDTSSTSNIKKETTVVPNIDIYTDDYIAACRFMEEKQYEESETSTTSNSLIHVKMCSVNKLVEREVNLTTERDYMNTYWTLNTNNMDYCNSYSAIVAPDMEFESVLKQEKQSIVPKKRHSSP
ncbi:unnamed protein product [Mytilus coruscus]|uniref:Uncharacterized protein n=1 Tax=Mytilus coruscus TaxID=42192 RepID=A0A6J8E573_MYTCO|nr:unnamed protein product [Mytilus coruscus]